MTKAAIPLIALPKKQQRPRRTRGVIGTRRDVWNMTPEDAAPENCSPVRCSEGEVAICVMCVADGMDEWNAKYTQDIYICNGWTLCGDCRYRLRHGHEPPHKAHYGSSDICWYDDESYQHGGASPAPHTLHRWQRTEITGAAHLRALLNCERDRGD